MKKILFFLLSVSFLLVFFSSSAQAADALLFDSTDHYLGGCQLTDKSAWELTKDLNVTIFQVWYKWNSGETELPVTVLKDGQEFAKFTAKRAQCDPYQAQWCNADFSINKLFPKGKYETKIPEARQCLKPNGTGAIRLYGTEGSTQASVQPAAVNPTCPTCQPQENQPLACSCNNFFVKTIIITALITFIVSFLIFFFVFKMIKR